VTGRKGKNKRERLVQLCAAAALAEPDMLAEELFLLLEGARVAAQSMGPQGLGDRLVRMGEAMINAHTIIEPAHQSKNHWGRRRTPPGCCKHSE
jgi:hypothetical protein